MREEVVAAPYAPIGLGEVKAWLRIEGSEEDALLAGLIRMATAACEEWTRLTPIRKTVVETVPPDGRRKLSRAPVQAIHEVIAVDDAGGERVLAPGEWLQGIKPDGTATLSSDAADAAMLKVRYTAGVAPDWNGVPDPLRHGIMVMVARHYAARDGDDDVGIPEKARGLWRSWRRLGVR